MLTIYSKGNCQFCEKAKALLKLKDVAFEEVRVDVDSSARQFLVDRGHRTVPQIYRGGELFVEGGYNGLANLTEDDFRMLRGN
jgi:glutaredoxin